MTVYVQNTQITSTFNFWRTRTNEIAYAVSNSCVTVNSNSAVGDAAITGKFTANSLNVANSSSNVNITIPTTAQVANGQYYLNANGNWSIASVYTDALTTSTTSDQLIDSYLMTDYRAADYIVHIKNLDANGFTVTKLLTYHDTGNGYVTEYAIMNSNSAGGVATLGVFSANANSTHVRVWVTPQPTAAEIKFTRIII
jgi:hypothetical protein